MATGIEGCVLVLQQRAALWMQNIYLFCCLFVSVHTAAARKKQQLCTNYMGYI